MEFAKSQRTVENREKKEKTGCIDVCDAPTTPVFKGKEKMMNDPDASHSIDGYLLLNSHVFNRSRVFAFRYLSDL